MPFQKNIHSCSHGRTKMVTWYGMQITNAIICICMHPATLPPSEWLNAQICLVAANYKLPTCCSTRWLGYRTQTFPPYHSPPKDPAHSLPAFPHISQLKTPTFTLSHWLNENYKAVQCVQCLGNGGQNDVCDNLACSTSNLIILPLMYHVPNVIKRNISFLKHHYVYHLSLL